MDRLAKLSPLLDVLVEEYLERLRASDDETLKTAMPAGLQPPAGINSQEHSRGEDYPLPITRAT
jgi:hypothetical protein